MSSLNLLVKTTEKKGTNGGSFGTPLSSWLDSVYPVRTGDHRPPLKKSKPLEDGVVDPEVVLDPPLDAETVARQYIAENPQINAGTLLNCLVADGFKIVREDDVDPEKKPSKPVEEDRHGLVNDPGEKDQDGRFGVEADTASANSQFLRSKESVKTKFQWKQGTAVKLSESSPRDDGIGYTRFDVVLLEEGLGNAGDNFYYTKDALKSAVTIFEGKKAFADHPDKVEEQIRPERSIRDVLGNFENLSYKEDDSGRGQLLGELVVLADKPYEWARGLLRHAVNFSEKYPDKEFVGLSINAGGVAAEISIDEFLANYAVPSTALHKINEAKLNGVETISVVSAIDEATSCDLVTEAGAGGKIKQFKESEGNNMKKFKERKKLALASLKAKLKEEGSAVAPSDEEVIKKMMRDEMSEMGMECGDEEISEMYEMYSKAKEMGKDDDGAMSLVKDMKKLQGMGAHTEEADDVPAKKDEEVSAKESLGNKNSLQQAAKIAVLEGRLDNRDTVDYVDKKLKESKLSRSVTKKFREAAGDIRSKGDFDSKFKVFVEAHNMAYEAMGETSPLLEKQNAVGGDAGSSFDFSDCVK